MASHWLSLAISHWLGCNQEPKPAKEVRVSMDQGRSILLDKENTCLAVLCPPVWGLGGDAGELPPQGFQTPTE